jgi:hypothetical protein
MPARILSCKFMTVSRHPCKAFLPPFVFEKALRLIAWFSRLHMCISVPAATAWNHAEVAATEAPARRVNACWKAPQLAYSRATTKRIGKVSENRWAADARSTAIRLQSAWQEWAFSRGCLIDLYGRGEDSSIGLLRQIVCIPFSGSWREKRKRIEKKKAKFLHPLL